MKNKNITAIILAGGKSSRMGRDKAFIKIGRKTIIEGIIETLKPLFNEIIIVANEPEKFKELNVKVVKDIKPNRGPLSGIHSGLVNSKTQLNFIVACDIPFIKPRTMRFIISKADGYDGAVPMIKDKPEPLHAAYSKSLIPLLEEALEGGDYALHKILSRANINFLNLKGFILNNINDKENLYKCLSTKGEYIKINRKQQMKNKWVRRTTRQIELTCQNRQN